MYNAVQLVGVRGSGGVRGGLHLLRQVSGAVQGVCGSPVEKSLFSVEEEQLQGQVRTGSLHGRQERRGSSHSFEMSVTVRGGLYLHLNTTILKMTFCFFYVIYQQ